LGQLKLCEILETFLQAFGQDCTKALESAENGGM